MDTIENTATPGTAIALATHFVERRDQKPFETGAPISAIVPRNLDELARVAAAIIKAGLAPDSYIVEPPKSPTEKEVIEAADKTKSRIMIGIMKGAEVGIPPISALSTIVIINNRPCIWGDGAVALIQSRGVVERWVESFAGDERTADAVPDDYGELNYAPSQRDFSDDFTAVCTIWRKGQSEPCVGRFSVRDARRANLWTNPKKKPWFEHPKRMLQWRARAYAMRDGFADCLMGLAIREEVEDLTPEPVVTDTSFLDDAVLEPAEVSQGQRALPTTGSSPVANGPPVAIGLPSEEPLPCIVITEEKPKHASGSEQGDVVEVEVTKERASMVAQPENDNIEPAQTELVKAETPKPETAAIPSIELNKPIGAKSPNWVRTREHLIAGFLELNTREACGQFRKKNSTTINQLRTNAKDEWDIYQEVAATHEQTISERKNAKAETKAGADTPGA